MILCLLDHFFFFFLPAQQSSSSVRNHKHYYGEDLAVTLADLLDLLPLSQGLPTSPSRCLDVWVNTLAPRTHSFFPHHSFPPLHFSPKKINTRLPPQVARGGAAGMERRGGRRSVESLIYLSLSGPGRPQWVFMCVCVCWGGGVSGGAGWWWWFGVFTMGAEREVSLPPWPLGWHSGSPSLSH